MAHGRGYRVDDRSGGPLAYLRWAAHDAWSWLAVLGTGLVLASAYAEEQGWVRFAGAVGQQLGLGVTIVALVSSASRWHVAPVERSAACVGRDVRALGGDFRDARGEARTDAAATRALLVQIRDRL